jgi:ribokinase
VSDVRVVVAGQLARDVVLVVDEHPPVGSAADVCERRDMLGGKGANQAVALAQLGVSVAEHVTVHVVGVRLQVHFLSSWCEK